MHACAPLGGIVASHRNLARSARGLELRSPGDFGYLAVQVLLCYCAGARLLAALGLLWTAIIRVLGVAPASARLWSCASAPAR